MWRRIFLSISLVCLVPTGQEVLRLAGTSRFLNSPAAIAHPDLSSNEQALPSGSSYQWGSEEQGIQNIRDAISWYRPSILARYGALENLSREEIKILKDDVYAITHGHFQVWELSRAMDQRSSPYFGGNHIKALMKVFSQLGLNPLGFKLDWSTEERGIESVRYVLSREVPGIIKQYDRLDKLTVEEINALRNNIYEITQGHFQVWGLGKVMNQQSAPYFGGSYMTALIAVFKNPRLELTEAGFREFRKSHTVKKYQWSSGVIEEGISNVKDAIRLNRPDLIERYGRLKELRPEEIEVLRNDIYRITAGYFRVWGLSRAMDQRSSPYFGGSFIEALMKVFSQLGLNPLGFELDWSTEERGIESVRYVLSREVPGIIERYDRLDKLTVEEIDALRNNIYGITQGYFKVWGLSSAMDQQSAPYFDGSHIEVLLKVFSDSSLGLTREGFLRNNHPVQNPSEENPALLLDVAATAL